MVPYQIAQRITYRAIVFIDFENVFGLPVFIKVIRYTSKFAELSKAVLELSLQLETYR